MMITDKELLELIDGTLGDSEARKVREMIDQNPDIKRRFETLSAVDNALANQQVHEPSSSFTENVMTNLNKKLSAATFSYNGFWKKNLVLVVSLILLTLIAGALILSSSTLPDMMPSIEPQEITVSERTFSIDPGKLNVIDKEIFFKGIVYLNAFLALFLLDRAVLKPYFKNRRQNYSF